MSSIIPYLTAQFRLHPSMTAQDLAKLCYQAAHGAEHLLSDLDRARVYLEREMDATEADGSLPLIEPISDGIARVNLAPWKARGLSADGLFELFAANAQVSGNGDAALEGYLNEVTDYLRSHTTPVSPTDWETFLTWYDGQGRPAIHHSPAYREAEKPAYRIVRRELSEDLPLE
jgi:hypothetical protein